MAPQTHPLPAGLLERRAVLPEVMGAPDVRVAFGLATDSAARRAILRGEAGPYIRRGRRLCVLRSTFLAHLESQAITVAPRTPPPAPKPPAWAVDLLAGKRRGPAPRRPRADGGAL